MPDVMVQKFEKRTNPNHKNRIGYFTRTARELKELIESESRSNELELKEVEQGDEGTKGNLPLHVIDHPLISYSFRGSTVRLSGLDNSFSHRIAKNGSGRS